MRSTISPAFTGSKMRSMFVLMRETAEQFISHFSKQIPSNEILTIDIKDAFTRYLNDVVANCAFGISCNSLQDLENEFYIKGKKATSLKGFRSIKLILYFMIPKLMKFLSIRVIEKELQDYFKDLVLNNMEQREKEKIIRMDMIHLLMEARKGRLKHEDTTEENDSFATAIESNLGQRNIKKGEKNNLKNKNMCVV